MIIGGIDVITTKKLQKTLKRKQERRNRPFTALHAPSSVLQENTSPESLASERRSSSNNSNGPVLTQKASLRKKKHSCNDFPTLSKTCDRYGVSDRAAAAMSSSVLYDIKSNIEVIDRHKVQRVEKN